MADEAPAITPVQTDNGAAPAAAAAAAPAAAAPATPAADAGGTPDPSAAAPAAAADTAALEGSTDAGDGSQATAPESYADFVMPDGVTADAAVLESAIPLFKEMGLSQEQAQKFVDFQAAQVQAGSQAQIEAFNQLTNGWREASENDKDFGGDKFEESVGVAREAIDKFGTPELKQLLEEHGVGNHPEVIRFMVRVGRLTREDVPGSSTGAASESKDHASILYPT